jgi:hypothetical protein
MLAIDRGRRAGILVCSWPWRRHATFTFGENEQDLRLTPPEQATRGTGGAINCPQPRCSALKQDVLRVHAAVDGLFRVERCSQLQWPIINCN